MTNQTCERWLRKTALLALTGALALGAPAFAQEKDGKKLEATDYVRPNHLVMAGYATPGTPMGAKFESYTGKILGGTVYYAVFRRTGRTGDAWGVRANFDSSFVEGENITDAQISYSFGDRVPGLSMLLQASNLTNEHYRTYAGTKDRPLENVEWGRTILFGASYKF